MTQPENVRDEIDALKSMMAILVAEARGLAVETIATQLRDPALIKAQAESFRNIKPAEVPQ